MTAPVNISASATSTALGGRLFVPSDARNKPNTTMMRVKEVVVTASTGTNESTKSESSRSSGEPSLDWVSNAAASLTFRTLQRAMT